MGDRNSHSTPRDLVCHSPAADWLRKGMDAGEPITYAGNRRGVCTAERSAARQPGRDPAWGREVSRPRFAPPARADRGPSCARIAL